MLEFKCANTPICDWEEGDGACVGHFTGTVRVEADMRRVSSIDGGAAFDTDEACERISLSQLCVDLNADETAVFCLYHDPLQQKEGQTVPSNAAEFTPGPWTVKGCVILTDDRNRNSVAIVYRFGVWIGGNTQYTEERAQATARLIAAAPDLLRAVEAMVPLIEKAFDYDSDVFGASHNDAVDAVATARAAVAKAKGTQP